MQKPGGKTGVADGVLFKRPPMPQVVDRRIKSRIRVEFLRCGSGMDRQAEEGAAITFRPEGSGGPGLGAGWFPKGL